MQESAKPSAGEQSRDRLLAAALEHVREHGIGEVSLRELARAIGTSHRMLLYHFGSREGLLVAVVRAMESAQREVLAALADGPPGDPADALRDMWRRLSDPGLWPHERLFFEMYGQALQGRAGTGELLPGVVETWVATGADYWRRQGVAPEAARPEARLGLAIVRGLLLDLLATRDHAGVDAAFERYVQLRTGLPATPPERAEPVKDPTTPMEAVHVVELLDCLAAHGVDVRLDGGWGVDALVGRQTRPHGDLDLVIDREWLPAATAALATLGYHHDPAVRPGPPARHVLRSAAGRQIDFHPITLDEHGNGWQRLYDGAWGLYPAAGLAGAGTVADYPVRCITAELQLRHHLGYPPTAEDRHDLRLLAAECGTPLPPEG